MADGGPYIALRTFEVLDEPMTLRELAAKIGCSVHSLDYVVRLLAAAGAVVVENAGPRCPRTVRRA